MRKMTVSLVGFFMILFSSLGMTSVHADGPEDVPSQSYEEGSELMIQSLTSSYYVRAFNCDGSSSLTSSSLSETSGYNWVVSKGTKGYIQSGGSGGTTLGVVLNNTIIDFSNSYLAKRGSANNASQVRAIQSTLSCLGYSVGSVDGVFGAQTEAAVKNFQLKRGLTADGIVGKQTYYYLSHATY